MPFDPIHRIDPILGSLPAVTDYGPALRGMPALGPRMAYQDAQGSAMGMLLPMLAMGLMAPGEADAPEMPIPRANAGFEPPAYTRRDVMPDALAFGPAFKRARQLGLQVFEWRGKRYTTELK